VPGGTGRNPITGKMLMATTDVVDNILINHNGSRYGKKQERSEEYYKRHACFFDLNQLDSLHRCLASLGVSRHQWIVDNITLLYENYPHRFDLLEEAIKSAHRHHLEFYAVLKPFEGADCSLLLPHTMPCPDHIAFSDLRGIIPGACPFVADHPEMSLKYRPGTSFIRKPVSHICLVKGDDRPTRVRPAHLSLFTSPTNNHFIPYSGSISFRETIESRYRFPYWRQCRIIHLDNLTIPPDHRYVLIRCSLTDSNGDFSNETGSIIELLDSGGMTIPDIVSTGPVSFEEHNAGFYRSRIMKDITRYLQHPDVRDEVADRQKMEQHYSDYFRFGDYHPGEITTLDAKGYIAAAAGKPDFMYGNLHPVYPEVQ